MVELPKEMVELPKELVEYHALSKTDLGNRDN